MTDEMAVALRTVQRGFESGATGPPVPRPVALVLRRSPATAVDMRDFPRWGPRVWTAMMRWCVVSSSDDLLLSLYGIGPKRLALLREWSEA